MRDAHVATLLSLVIFISSSNSKSVTIDRNETASGVLFNAKDLFSGGSVLCYGNSIDIHDEIEVRGDCSIALRPGRSLDFEKNAKASISVSGVSPDASYRALFLL